MFALITQGDMIFIFKIAKRILTYKHPNFFSIYFL